MVKQVIDDRDEDWFRHVMDAIEHARGDRKAVSEVISSEILGEGASDSNRHRGGIDAH